MIPNAYGIIQTDLHSISGPLLAAVEPDIKQRRGKTQQT
jgi:hypothetical protein